MSVSPKPSSLIVHRSVNSDGRLAVEYSWNEDRFVHRILVDDTEVARSIDSDAENDWPDSPPIQQISLEPINDQPTILGVGGAGRGHWSISVGRNPQQPNSIRFDIACRVKETPKFLGSSYRVSGELAIEAVVGEVVTEASLVRVLQRETLSGNLKDTYRWVYDVAIPEPELS
ncbi:hypothetical protein Pla22_21480 [Rubripirellula amarantea]|uniref:Uncharacterized protein n=1 Tax=Rubripirellula amarantea TaxID=2527999 RepID=A0A5C5WWI1_9BACT|nr:hypothetical protein [Rubripirellula amarantea]TWT54501.1 hypothetical protein Pla22_21480 [Rubripirellula amarantea]